MSFYIVFYTEYSKYYVLILLTFNNIFKSQFRQSKFYSKLNYEIFMELLKLSIEFFIYIYILIFNLILRQKPNFIPLI